MTLIVNADLTGLQTFPSIADFVLGVPATGLVSVFRAGVHVTEIADAISQWLGTGGYAASQATAGARPTLSGGAVAFDGADDYLSTAIAPPTSGYMVAKIVAQTIATTGIYAGSQETTTARMAAGYSATMKPGFQIGSTTVTSFQGTTVLVDGQEYVIGCQWHDGTATIRVAGAEENSTTYNGSGETVGTSAIYLGARNTAGSASAFSPASIKALAVYSGSSLDLAAIDAAMAAF